MDETAAVPLSVFVPAAPSVLDTEGSALPLWFFPPLVPADIGVVVLLLFVGEEPKAPGCLLLVLLSAVADVGDWRLEGLWAARERLDALREGGPTKSDGAGRRDVGSVEDVGRACACGRGFGLDLEDEWELIVVMCRWYEWPGQSRFGSDTL